MLESRQHFFNSLNQPIKVQTSPQTKKLLVITAVIVFIIYLIPHIFHTLQFTILLMVKDDAAEDDMVLTWNEKVSSRFLGTQNHAKSLVGASAAS